MKSVLAFIRTTLTGGILFLLPVVLLIIVGNKAHHILLKVSRPLANKMPDRILGLDGSSLVAIALLVIICFVAGLVFRSPYVRRRVEKLEDNVLSYLPGYTMIKSITTDAIGGTSDNTMTTVLVRDGDTWKIGFLVEQDVDWCTVFIPDAPRHDAGEVKIVPASWIKKTNVATDKAAKSIQRYGKGSLEWLRQN